MIANTLVRVGIDVTVGIVRSPVLAHYSLLRFRSVSYRRVKLSYVRRWFGQSNDCTLNSMSRLIETRTVFSRLKRNGQKLTVKIDYKPV